MVPHARSVETARAELREAMKKAMERGRKLLVLLGASPPNLRHFCDAATLGVNEVTSSLTPRQLEAFDFEKLPKVAESLGGLSDLTDVLLERPPRTSTNSLSKRF